MFVGQTVFLELRNNHALMGAFEQLICQKCYMLVMFQVNLYMYVRRISDLLYNVLNYLTKWHFL